MELQSSYSQEVDGVRILCPLVVLSKGGVGGCLNCAIGSESNWLVPFFLREPRCTPRQCTSYKLLKPGRQHT